MKQTGKTKTGFTLMEMLAVIFIMVMLSSIILAGYKDSEKRKRVAFAVDSITNSITQAQSYTMTGKKTTNSNSNCRTPKYYFLTFDYTQSYTLSAMNNCDTVDLIETFKLPAQTNIKASSLILDGSSVSSSLKISFYPPFAQLKALGSGTVYNSFSNALITIQSKDGSIERTIRIDGIVGRIQSS